MKLIGVVLLTVIAAAQPQQQQSTEQQQRAQQQARAAQELREKIAAVPQARSGDVDSIEHLLAATYDVISGPAGDRDWNRFRSLFYPGARLAAVRHPENGSPALSVFTPEDYIERGGGYFKTHGFFERSSHNHIDRFGNIAQVFSTYESRNAASEQPFARGINSFQLFNDGKRWWVLTIYWDEESQGNPIPAEFK